MDLKERKKNNLCPMALSVKVANLVENEQGKPGTMLNSRGSPGWSQWQTSQQVEIQEGNSGYERGIEELSMAVQEAE